MHGGQGATKTISIVGDDKSRKGKCVIKIESVARSGVVALSLCGRRRVGDDDIGSILTFMSTSL